MAHQYDVILLQETHAGRHEFALAYRPLLRDFDAIVSPDRSLSTRGGGCITLLRKKLTRDCSIDFNRADIDEHPQHFIIPGRCIRTAITNADRDTLIVYNIHFHGWSEIDTRKVCAMLKSDLLVARNDPRKTTVIVGGDFNGLLVNSRKYRDFMGTTGTRTAASAEDANGRIPNLILDALSGFCEIEQPLPTHITGACDGISNSYGRLDGFFTSIPAWANSKLQTDSRPTHGPFSMRYNKLSDHSPVHYSVDCRAELPTRSRPIHPSIFRHPRFSPLHKDYCDAIKLDDLPTWKRSDAHKTIIRAVAKIVRDEITAFEGELPFSRGMLLEATARAVWTADVTLAKLILDNNPFASHYLAIENNVPTIKN